VPNSRLTTNPCKKLAVRNVALSTGERGTDADADADICNLKHKNVAGITCAAIYEPIMDVRWIASASFAVKLSLEAAHIARKDAAISGMPISRLKLHRNEQNGSSSGKPNENKRAPNKSLAAPRCRHCATSASKSKFNRGGE
jgi:hypothetical protein